MNPAGFIRFVLRMGAIACITAIFHGFIRFRQLLRLEKRRPADIVGLWGKWMCRVMGIRVHFRNERKHPRGAILISNHMGFLDIPVLLSIYPAVFIIKAELGRMRMAGKILRHQGHIFVDRENADSRRRAGEDLAQAMRSGDRVIVFPEGRGTTGAKRLPFKPLSFFLAAELKKPVEVVLIDYLPDRREVAWDSSRPMFPQFASLLGRRRHDVGVEYLASYVPENPKAEADGFRLEMEQRLQEYDAEILGSTGVGAPLGSR